MGRVLLAEYFITEEQTLLFLVRADYEEPAVETVDLSAEAALRFARESFSGDRSPRSVDLASWQERFGALVAPIAGHCDKDDIVWFVPHGPLHYLPLHALSLDGQYLIERNPVCYSPSASVMRYCKAKRTGRRERALVVGDSRGDLVYAREEALTIADLFGVRPYLREEATKAVIGDLLARDGERMDVLHLACHGHFDAEDALRSGILLAPPDGDPTAATLTAEELLAVRLRADLVTLSACESGVSENRPGDELIGLTRALIYAGTPSVIVSLWRVDDLSTGLLMRGFYERLLRPGPSTPATKVHALQAAQLEVMRCTAGELVAECTSRLDGFADDDLERRRILELELASAHAAAGDLDRAIAACEVAARDPAVPRLAERAQRRAQILRFRRKWQQGPPEVDYDCRPFEHPAHWAPFVLVGDWE